MSKYTDVEKRHVYKCCGILRRGHMQLRLLDVITETDPIIRTRMRLFRAHTQDLLTGQSQKDGWDDTWHNSPPRARTTIHTTQTGVKAQRISTPEQTAFPLLWGHWRSSRTELNSLVSLHKYNQTVRGFLSDHNTAVEISNKDTKNYQKRKLISTVMFLWSNK